MGSGKKKKKKTRCKARARALRVDQTLADGRMALEASVSLDCFRDLPTSSPAVMGGDMLAAQSVDGEYLLARMGRCWEAGDWAGLAELADRPLRNDPNRANLALLAAIGHQQLGHSDQVRALVRAALDWGCPVGLLRRVLVGGAYQLLGRAAIIRADEAAALRLLQKSVGVAMPGMDLQRALAQKTVVEPGADGDAKLGVLPPAAIEGDTSRGLGVIVEECLAAADLYEAVDAVVADGRLDPKELVCFYLALSKAFHERQDLATAQHFAHLAQESLPENDPELAAGVVRWHWDMGRRNNAVDLAIEEALNDSPIGRALGHQYLSSIALHFRQWRLAVLEKSRHGQGLLLAYLTEHVEAYRCEVGGRIPVVIEVGTTRELLDGQGSTRELAEFCHARGLQFITVDMDPHCTRMAQRLFEHMGFRCQAVTAKGEEFLRGYPGPVDFAFLDAYDFDHGKHSALRQSRYERFLGGRIDEQLCHRMHLDCAESLVGKLAESGVICIDDAWLENGCWVAKGTLAVPYLLSRGFEVLAAANRAVLLRKALASPQTDAPTV